MRYLTINFQSKSTFIISFLTLIQFNNYPIKKIHSFTNLNLPNFIMAILNIQYISIPFNSSYSYIEEDILSPSWNFFFHLNSIEGSNLSLCLFLFFIFFYLYTLFHPISIMHAINFIFFYLILLISTLFSCVEWPLIWNSTILKSGVSPN